MASVPNGTIVLDMDVDSATYGKFVCTDLTDWVTAGYVLANMKGYWNFVFPDGSVRLGNLTTPDINGATPDLVFNTLAIPLTALGGFQKGTYKFQFFAQSNASGTLTDFSSELQEFTLDPPTDIFDECDGTIKDACLDVSVNCIFQVITVKDTTNYGTWTVVYSLSLHLPKEAADEGTPDPGAVAASSFQYAFEWVHAAYEFFANNLASYTVAYTSGTVTAKIRVKKSLPKIIDCSYNLCSLITCYEEYFAKINKRICKVGSFSKLQVTEQDDFFFLNAKINAYLYGINCNYNATVLQALYDDVKADLAILNPGCDCGCADDKPTKIQLTPAVSSYTFAGQPGYINVTNIGGNVTYTLDATFLANLALYVTNITSTDGSVGLTPSGPTSGVKTFNLDIVQHLSVEAIIAWGGSFPLVITQANFKKQGGLFLTSCTIALKTAAADLAALKKLDAVFAISAFQTTEPSIGTDHPYKVTADIVNLTMNDAAGETDTTFPQQMQLELCGKDHQKTYFRLIDIDGLIVSMDRFITEVETFKIAIKIQE